jgi:orotidine-5'-phosphate decarboxylase
MDVDVDLPRETGSDTMVADSDLERKWPLLSHRLAARATALQTWLCVGLDPHLGSLPSRIPRNASGIERFCRSIIEATGDLVPAFKINFAFFEALGSDGWRTLERVRTAIPSDAIVIADAKRGDIGNTSEGYASAVFDSLGFDAVTVNPYLGWDALEPFFLRTGKMVYVLCKTSNPGAGVYQDQLLDGTPLYLHVARDAARQPARAEIGLVVGATQLDALTAVRRELPHVSLLVPGVGAQGARVSDVFPTSGENALITISRQILYASSESDFASAATSAARALAHECWDERAV